jgi:hypothetical protein
MMANASDYLTRPPGALPADTAHVAQALGKCYAHLLALAERSAYYAEQPTSEVHPPEEAEEE